MDKKNFRLKELQNIELDMLRQFINICDKLELNYFLIGGTLIGAIRHKGFIPWDDDIDVCMMRKDYEIFLKEAQKYLDKKYFLQTYETDKDYVQCFAKIRNSETTFMEKSVADYEMNHGIFIDIFPFDNYYKYNKIKKRLLIDAIYNLKRNKKNNYSFIKKIEIIISKIIYGRKSKIELCRKLDEIYTKRDNIETEKVVNYSGAWGIKKEYHFKEDFDGYKIVEFEGIKSKVPVGYDRILTDTYGDYMKLPPKEKRVSHHFSEIIDTKKSYKEYTNSIDKEV